MSKQNKIIENRDMANFDFSGYIDGIKFPGGTAKGHQMIIGLGRFIPGFEEQMIGMANGEERNIKLNFPNGYYAAELAGKEAIFKVKINGIKKKR